MKGTMGTTNVCPARLPISPDTQTTCIYWHRVTTDERSEPPFESSFPWPVVAATRAG